MKNVSKHMLRGASYLFDFSLWNSRKMRTALAWKYSLRGMDSDAEMLKRDMERIGKDTHIAFAALRKRYE